MRYRGVCFNRSNPASENVLSCCATESVKFYRASMSSAAVHRTLVRSDRHTQSIITGKSNGCNLIRCFAQENALSGKRQLLAIFRHSWLPQLLKTRSPGWQLWKSAPLILLLNSLLMNFLSLLRLQEIQVQTFWIKSTSMIRRFFNGRISPRFAPLQTSRGSGTWPSDKPGTW